MDNHISDGGFTVARKIFSSTVWIKDPLYLKVWLWIIGRASHSDHGKGGKDFKRGEFFTTYDEVIKAASYYFNRKFVVPTIKQIRVILKWLESEGMIIVN